MSISAVVRVAAVAVVAIVMAACSSARGASPSAPVAQPEPAHAAPTPVVPGSASATPRVPLASATPGLPGSSVTPDLSEAPASPIAINRTVTVDTEAGPRTAVVHHPAGLHRGAPMVVVLHGAYGSGEQARNTFGWDALADREGVLVAYPNGVGRTWNAGHCCGPAHNAKIDDVAFLHRLVEQLVVQDGVDRYRVYAVGMSNGAMMAYAWACGRPHDLAGIGPVAGALVTDCPQPPVLNVVAVHGGADHSVPVTGGIGPKSVTRFKYPPLATTLAPFLAADRCAPTPRRNDRAAVHVSTYDCLSGAGVTVAVIDGVGHDWPGSRVFDPVRRVLRESFVPLDATNFLWTHLRTVRMS
ncbi:MAG: hypothetical protein JO100_15060 [Pseudonocardia sp.]|nr:hypothetical protein [Pseudonocardia sp.]